MNKYLKKGLGSFGRMVVMRGGGLVGIVAVEGIKVLIEKAKDKKGNKKKGK